MTEPVRLEIDLNDRTPEGLVPADLPDGVTVQPGQKLVAYEPEDQVAAPAVVRRTTERQAFLDVDWNAMRDEASSRYIVGHDVIGIAMAATQATDSWYDNGCARDCAEQHTYAWGRCALAPESARPEPTITVGRVEIEADGQPGIVMRSVPLHAWNALIEVAQWVSRGRSAAFIPDDNLGRVYPDAKARRALGALHEAGLLKAGSTAGATPITQPDRPRHPNGEPYSYAELEVGNWGFCDGCRRWSNGTIERPHQCSETHIHGPFSKEQQ